MFRRLDPNNQISAAGRQAGAERESGDHARPRELLSLASLASCTSVLNPLTWPFIQTTTALSGSSIDTRDAPGRAGCQAFPLYRGLGHATHIQSLPPESTEAAIVH